VPYTKWTGHKPDVSHLRVFGSIGYANIPKKIRGGKLAATSVKCRLLGWAADETKGYRLEVVETRKLMYSRDVTFAEDDAPNDLAVVETSGSLPGSRDITSDDLESSQVQSEAAEATEGQTDALGDAPMDQEQAPEPTPAPKPSKWAKLPPREPSGRNRKETKHFGIEATEEEIRKAESQRTEHQAYVTYASEPRNYYEAIQSPASKQWEKAMSAELAQLKQTGTYAWVPEAPQGRRVVGSRWVLKEKCDGQGDVVTYKARVVAQGCSQVPGQDYNATFASVARFTTLRALSAIAAHEDWELHQVDVRSAYLQGDLEEEVYMRVPDGAVKPGKEGWLWKLRKALYRLKQAG